MLTMYANAFKIVNQRSKAFCMEIFQLQWLDLQQEKPDKEVPQ